MGEVGNGNGEMKRMFITIIITVTASIIATHFSTQNQTENAFRERMSIVETKMQYMLEMVTEIKADVRATREDNRRVLDDWINGVDRRTGEPLPLQRSREQGR